MVAVGIHGDNAQRIASIYVQRSPSHRREDPPSWAAALLSSPLDEHRTWNLETKVKAYQATHGCESDCQSSPHPVSPSSLGTELIIGGNGYKRAW